MKEFLQNKAPINTIIFDKKFGYGVLTALSNLSRLGDLSFTFDDFELLVDVIGNVTGNFTVPISEHKFVIYDISDPIKLTDVMSAKLLTMISEIKKSVDRIEINTTRTTIYLYTTFDGGSELYYEIDIDADVISLRNAVGPEQEIVEKVITSTINQPSTHTAGSTV